MNEFVNHCWASCSEGEAISFRKFADFMLPMLPPADEPMNILHYIGAKAHDLLAETKIPSMLSYKQLLAILWSEPRLGFSPVQMRCFAYAARWDGDGWVQYVDDRGLPLLVFTRKPEGFGESYFTQSTGRERAA
jgi:hypothetical protein